MLSRPAQAVGSRCVNSAAWSFTKSPTPVGASPVSLRNIVCHAIVVALDVKIGHDRKVVGKMGWHASVLQSSVHADSGIVAVADGPAERL